MLYMAAIGDSDSSIGDSEEYAEAEETYEASSLHGIVCTLCLNHYLGDVRRS